MNIRNPVKIQLVISLFILCLLTLYNPCPAFSSSGLEKLSEIKKTIKSKLIKVKKDKKKEESLKSKIDKIGNRIGTREKEIKKFETKIAATNRKIDKISSEINAMTDNMGDRNEIVQEYIKSLHKQQHNSSMIILVSAADYQDFIKKSRYISLIADHNGKVISSYKKDLERIEEKKKELVKLQATLESNQSSARKKKQKLQYEKKKKRELFSKVRSRRIAHEKKIKKLEASSKKLQNMVSKLKAKKIPGAIIGPGFQSQKGALPWPVNGRIISRYGKYKDRFDIPVTKNGIGIRAGQGENPKAIAGGRVVYSGKFTGYGNLIIIDHGNGFHSLYGNLAETSIQESVLLVEGMDVGSAGKSDKNGESILYFEIRHKGRPVNPLKWLKRRS